MEGEVGWFRRNWLVPVPEAADLAALNRAIAGWLRWQAGAGRSVGQEHDRRRSQPDGTSVICCRWRRKDSRLRRFCIR